MRLNTFPSAWPDPNVNQEDCLWTAMNFFNEQPDPRFLDREQVKEALKTEYQIVDSSSLNPEHAPAPAKREIVAKQTGFASSTLAFGDLVTLANKHGDIAHMCVYLAEDFVYTKNGYNPLSPWVIMKISDMLLLFPSEEPYRLITFRRLHPVALGSNGTDLASRQ